MQHTAERTSTLDAGERWQTTVEAAQRAARFGVTVEISGDHRPTAPAVFP